MELSAPLAPGWARATCSGPVKASLLFRQYNIEGMPTGEAGVNVTTVPATRFVTFAEHGEGKSGTGVPYANPSSTAALVTLTARDSAGQSLDSVVRTGPQTSNAASGGCGPGRAGFGVPRDDTALLRVVAVSGRLVSRGRGRDPTYKGSPRVGED